MTSRERRPWSYLQLAVSGACVAATCWALIIFKPWYPLVRFDSERVSVAVDPERITVEGLYQLYNPFPFSMVQHFFYPIPAGGGLQPVDRILIESLSDPGADGPGQLSPLRKGDLGYYRVTVPGGGTLKIRAVYSQKHGGRYGRYILTTTGTWGRPLRMARFELELDSVDLIDSNYELSDNEKGTLTFQRTNFTPEDDWVFSFKLTGGRS